MTKPLTRDTDSDDGLETFLSEFFAAAGNDAWPDLSPQFRWADRVEPFIELARRRTGDAPIVLPRMVAATDSYSMYVVVLDKTDTVRVAELINAFAGPTYSRMPKAMQPTVLDPHDSVDASVIRFVGHGTTFKIQTTVNRADRKKLTDALLLMQRTLARRPHRSWKDVKPTGRLLAEFDAAVAAGSEATSAQLLEQLAVAGGLDASNIAYLRIKRLHRLGKDAEVLALPRLGDIVRQSPPVPVRDAVLAALYFQLLERPLTSGDLSSANSALRLAGRHVLELMRGDLTRLSSESLAVSALAAIIREDRPTLRQVVETAREGGRYADLPAVLREKAAEFLQVEAAATQPGVDGYERAERSETPVIRSWLAYIEAVATGAPSARDSAEQNAWETWAPPAEDDAAIARLLDELTTDAAQRVWAAVGPFIEAVGYAKPAGLTAGAFIRNALTFDRFSPGDLLALQALVEITLRQAPNASDYAALLGDIGAESRRWVAIEQAAVVLDIVDTLVLSACPDSSARQNLAVLLLGPLAEHASRLDPAHLAFARLLTTELGLGFDWQVPAAHEESELPSWRNSTLSLLLYSLDEKVLGRVSEQLAELVPDVRVKVSSDHVGGPQLRQRVRHADVVIMVTRCAKHAATGFIGQHAGPEKIAFVEGSGSASVLRTALAEIRKRTSGA